MNGLDDMKMRLNYAGGAPQQSRMIADKLRSLKKALLYSYQAGTMVVDNPYEDYDVDSLEFRCLMNPDKLTFDADLKMLSVPLKTYVLIYRVKVRHLKELYKYLYHAGTHLCGKRLTPAG